MRACVEYAILWDGCTDRAIRKRRRRRGRQRDEESSRLKPLPNEVVCVRLCALGFRGMRQCSAKLVIQVSAILFNNFPASETTLHSAGECRFVTETTKYDVLRWVLEILWARFVRLCLYLWAAIYPYKYIYINMYALLGWTNREICARPYKMDRPVQDT